MLYEGGITGVLLPKGRIMELQEPLPVKGHSHSPALSLSIQ